MSLLFQSLQLFSFHEIYIAPPLTFAFWSGCTSSECVIIRKARELVVQTSLGPGAFATVQSSTDVHHVGTLGHWVGESEVDVLEIKGVLLFVVLCLLGLGKGLTLVAES